MINNGKRISTGTTAPDRQLDKHVVISEHRKSCYWKTSENGFRKDNATIAGLQIHILLISCLMIKIYTVGLFCSARVALELRTVWCRDKSKNMSAQPDQSDDAIIRRRDLGLKSHPKDRRSGVLILRSLCWLCCYPLHYRRSQPHRKIRFRTNRNHRQCRSQWRDISAEWYRGKRDHLLHAYNNYQNQIAQLIEWEFIFHLIRTCAYTYTNQMLQTRRLSRVFLANPKV